MANPFCTFSYQPNNTFVRMYYRTSTFGVAGSSSSIFYRKNEGPWIQIPNIISHQGPTYLQVFDIQAKTNDKIDYYFANTTGTLDYGVGQNGPYFGQTGIVTSIMIFGANYIYLNICSRVDTAGVVDFCPNNLYWYCATRCLVSTETPPVYVGNCWSNTNQPKFQHPTSSLSVGTTVTGTDGYCYTITEEILPINYPSIAGPIVTLNTNTTLAGCYVCSTVYMGYKNNINNATCTTSGQDYIYYRINNGPWQSFLVSAISQSGYIPFYYSLVAPGIPIDYYFSTGNVRPWGVGLNSGDFTSKCTQIGTTITTPYYNEININIDSFVSGTNCQFKPPCV